MSLPFTTNTVTIEEADDSGDKWEARTYATAASQVPCIISMNDTNTMQHSTGQRAKTDATLFMDRAQALTSGARITDDVTGVVYLVDWVADRIGFGLDRREAGLKFVEGI